MVPYLLLGTGSIVSYHDQLDGELLSYVLTAKYLFTDIRVYPELMNGLPATGAVPPAPLFVLFYVFCKPFTAFLLSQWVIYLVGFLGMYLLLLCLTEREFLSFSISVIFMLLPFYPVYGLCIPGQPLLFYAVLHLTGRESVFRGQPGRNSFANRKMKFTSPARCAAPLTDYFLIIFYGASSSLVLVGFACLLLLGLYALSLTIRSFCESRRENNASLFTARRADAADRITSASLSVHQGKLPAAPWLAFFTLFLTYVVTNLGLLKQVLFPGTAYVSHKTEIVLSPQDAWESLQEVFTNGISYAQSYHTVLFLLIALCGLVVLFRSWIFADQKPDGERRRLADVRRVFSEKSLFYLRSAARVFLFILLISLFYVFYHANRMTSLRNSSNGILKTFNLDRVCWLLPAAWCILAGYLFCFLCDAWEDFSRAACRNLSASHFMTADARSGYLSSFRRSAAAAALLRRTLPLLILCIWGAAVLLHTPLRPNLAKLLRGGDYYALDWDRFFAEDIYTQIDAAIGRAKQDYHVVSVGIYPAAAAYNGFYCLDGYSNNYPLEYKHTFRRIIEGELEKSDYVRDFFDNWGNRCYITTAEQGNYYTFEKKWGSVIYNLDINTDKLKELNCDYIFSAAYLMNAEELGLTLLQEAPFETEKSWYHIYVYCVN